MRTISEKLVDNGRATGAPGSPQILQVQHDPCFVIADLMNVEGVLGYKLGSWETTTFLFAPASAVGSPH